MEVEDLLGGTRRLLVEVSGLDNISSEVLTTKARGHRLTSLHLMMYNMLAMYMTVGLQLSGATLKFTIPALSLF